jgi:hypothetical protein
MLHHLRFDPQQPKNILKQENGGLAPRDFISYLEELSRLRVVQHFRVLSQSTEGFTRKSG